MKKKAKRVYPFPISRRTEFADFIEPEDFAAAENKAEPNTAEETFFSELGDPTAQNNGDL